MRLSVLSWVVLPARFMLIWGMWVQGWRRDFNFNFAWNVYEMHIWSRCRYAGCFITVLVLELVRTQAGFCARVWVNSRAGIWDNSHSSASTYSNDSYHSSACAGLTLRAGFAPQYSVGGSVPQESPGSRSIEAKKFPQGRARFYVAPI